MTTLYFKDATSDKVYQAEIKSCGALYNVEFAYGRRGSTMMTGKKNSMPVDLGAARSIFDKLIREKLAKGYTPGEDGAAYVSTDKEERFTGVLPMLLNTIEEDELNALLRNDDWVAEEKFDGRRMVLRKNQNGSVDAINRKGLIVGAPEIVIKEAQALPGVFTLDGEIIGERHHAFDTITDTVWWDRKKRLHALMGYAIGTHISEVKTYWGASKLPFFEDLKARHAEGIVLKNLHGFYHAGRPNKGGDALKFKFYETITCVVTKVNTQRSVGISLLGEWQEYAKGINKRSLISVGNVTIPPNFDIPKENDLAEVRYLYTTAGGILYQPVYRGTRDDVDVDTIERLKYETGEEEDEN